MKIEITSNCKMIDLEAKLRLAYRRKRVDYKKLLISIKEGNSLLDEFPKSIANSIEDRLQQLKFIDSGKSITELGNEMIGNPELIETEVGVFSVKIVQFELNENHYNLIPEVSRQLSKKKRDLVDYRISGLESNNQIVLDNEIVRFTSIRQQGQSKKVYIKEGSEEFNLRIDLVNNIYQYGSKSLELGDSLLEKLRLYTNEVLHNNPYGRFEIYSHVFVLDNGLANLSNQEILNRKINRFEVGSLVVEDMDILIDNEKTAKEYLYKIAYNKLQKNEYYSLSDLNDIFINEIFGSGIFSEDVQNQIFDFTYEINGFSSYLPKDEYESLQYKLNVLELLLGFSLVTDDFANVTDYKTLTKTFNTFVPSKSVEECYVVMGYPFVRNSRNKFSDFYDSFSKTYKNIAIIKKGNANQKEDTKIIELFKELEVPIYEMMSLKEHYHDRYIIFKKKDNQYKVFLVTSEIGQFFKKGTAEKMGLIKELDYSEITRTNKSNNLIKLIERGINNA